MIFTTIETTKLHAKTIVSRKAKQYTGEKMYSCNDCDFSSKYPVSLKRHVKKNACKH